MHRSHFTNERRNDEYILMIREGGFSGIAGILWGAGYLRKILGKSTDDVVSKDTKWLWSKTAIRWTGSVEKGRGRLCYIGRMMRGSTKRVWHSQTLFFFVHISYDTPLHNHCFPTLHLFLHFFVFDVRNDTTIGIFDSHFVIGFGLGMMSNCWCVLNF